MSLAPSGRSQVDPSRRRERDEPCRPRDPDAAAPRARARSVVPAGRRHRRRVRARRRSRGGRGGNRAPTSGAVRAAAAPWKPWFPVIDYSRCTNCMQCLSFCLFDVYGVSADSKIQVQNQSNCKTECPACSRVCPEVAIMFPKYRHGPINGEEVKADDVRREAMKVDISALLGGDIYSMLRDRSVEGEVALLEGTRRRPRAEGAAELPDRAQARPRHPGGSAGGAAVARRDPGEGRSGARRGPRRRASRATRRPKA